MKVGSVVSCLRRMRFSEAMLITGFSVMGYVSASHGSFTLLDGDTLLFLFIAYMIILSIYLFNSWTGYEKDRLNSRLGPVNDCPRSFFLITAAISGLVSCIPALCISTTLAGAVVTVFLLWWLYSAWWKYRPFLGTLLHVCVQAVQYHLGYFFLGRSPSAESLFAAMYLGLIFAAGHLHHELIDYDADKAAGVSSGAIFMGMKRALMMCLTVFFASFMLLVVLVISGDIASSFAVPFIAAHILQFVSWAVLAKSGGSNLGRLLLRHRTVYRFLFFGAGLAYLAVSM